MALTGIEGVVSGNVAGVDSSNRLLTKALIETPQQQVITNTYTTLDDDNITVPALSNRNRLILQSLATVPVALKFAALDAAATDLNLLPGVIYEVPFKYTSQFRVYGIGGGGPLVVIETTD